MLSLNLKHVLPFLSYDEIFSMEQEVTQNLELLQKKTGLGNDFLGWMDLPVSYDHQTLSRFHDLSNEFRNKIDFLVVIGIGGSYLGARAIADALSDNFSFVKEKKPTPKILFAGHHLSEEYLYELMEFLNDQSYGIVVISKSGTTTEPALAFRLLKNHLQSKVGPDEAIKRIIAITDAKKGALRQMSELEGYQTFIIPDNVGGRFSVFSPVGLLPLSIIGVDIKNLLEGAKEMMDITSLDVSFKENPASLYAAVRNGLYRKGKNIEILVNYNPKLNYFAEWWKQLFGESEGKENKGIFPASVSYTTDLHSLGQYIQDGLRNIFETIITVKRSRHAIIVPNDKKDLDKLNYISGKQIDEVNKMAELGTIIAHVDGGVPNLQIEIDALDEFHLGQMIYLFEKACAISGYTLGINPFDQPGVEAYKKNMFALLGKPGYEKETENIKNKLT